MLLTAKTRNSFLWWKAIGSMMPPGRTVLFSCSIQNEKFPRTIIFFSCCSSLSHPATIGDCLGGNALVCYMLDVCLRVVFPSRHVLDDSQCTRISLIEYVYLHRIPFSTSRKKVLINKGRHHCLTWVGREKSISKSPETTTRIDSSSKRERNDPCEQQKDIFLTRVETNSHDHPGRLVVSPTDDTKERCSCRKVKFFLLLCRVIPTKSWRRQQSIVCYPSFRLPLARCSCH